MVELAKYQALAGVTFALLIIVVTLSGSSQGQTPASGKELFEKRCGGCHSLDRDKEGPRLRGINNRLAGSIESFQYSDALKNSKITWNAEMLNRWISDPEKLVPNNDMSFHLDKSDERQEIIAYLQSSK